MRTSNMRAAARAMSFLFCGLHLALVPVASAEEPPAAAKSEEQWLKELRASASYKAGIEALRQSTDRAYDEGAIRGAKHWETIHGYYLAIAEAKGCALGKRFARGPVESCRKVPGSEPSFRGKLYEEGRDKTLREAPAQRALLSFFDYGYAQGMRHGLRSHNDDLEWMEAFFKACITRANEAEAEPVCARESRAWSKVALDELNGQIASFVASEKAYDTVGAQ